MFGQLRRVLKPDNDPLAQRCQGGLDLLGLCVVLGVEHPADNGLTDAKLFCQPRISHSALAHGYVEGEFRHRIEQNADRMLASLQLRRGRNRVADAARRASASLNVASTSDESRVPPAAARAR